MLLFREAVIAINQTVSLYLEVPPELAQEIGSRDDAISFLKDILQNDDYWNHGGPGDAWGQLGKEMKARYCKKLRLRRKWGILRRK